MFAVVKDKLFAVAQHASSVCWSKGQSRVLSLDICFSFIVENHVWYINVFTDGIMKYDILNFVEELTVY